MNGGGSSTEMQEKLASALKQAACTTETGWKVGDEFPSDHGVLDRCGAGFPVWYDIYTSLYSDVLGVVARTNREPLFREQDQLYNSHGIWRQTNLHVLQPFAVEILQKGVVRLKPKKPSEILDSMIKRDYLSVDKKMDLNDLLGFEAGVGTNLYWFGVYFQELHENLVWSRRVYTVLYACYNLHISIDIHLPI
jgi:hypothetical protein